MPLVRNDKHLLDAAKHGNMNRAKAALEAGANVDGSPALPCAPILAATISNHVGMVDFLLQQRADPDKPITEEMAVPCSGPDYAVATPGQRALHIAAWRGNVEIVHLLVKQSSADPNATDHEGNTPLMATCRSVQARAEVVRLLLEAGADPAVADKNGVIPLHVVAFRGFIGLVDMLYSKAPATLNRFNRNGETALFSACSTGHESMVSKLLSLGAMQPMALRARDMCPLLVAMSQGFVGVVIVLISEKGMRAVGGLSELSKAFYMSVRFNQTKILRRLLTVYGEQGRSMWANVYLDGKGLLQYAAEHCSRAAVSVLLEAGADEAARDSEGRIPREVIGLRRGRDRVQIDRGEDVAIRRMLQRGPAYRARSWAWPSDEEPDAGGSGDGQPAGVGVGGGGGGVPSPPPAVKTPSVIGVGIFQPKEKSSSKFFVRLIGRYCAKD